MIILPESNKKIEEYIEVKTKRENVEFALNVVYDVIHLHDLTPEIEKCIDFIEKWLISKQPINHEDFRVMTDALGWGANYERNVYIRNTVFTACCIVKNNDYFCGTSVYWACYASENFSNIMNFYINEARGLILEPHSEQTSPIFDLANKEEFQVALDWLIEYKHENLIQYDNKYYYFKFYDFVQENSINELVNTIFNNLLYKKQTTRVLTRLLNYV